MKELLKNHAVFLIAVFLFAFQKCIPLIVEKNGFTSRIMISMYGLNLFLVLLSFVFGNVKKNLIVGFAIIVIAFTFLDFFHMGIIGVGEIVIYIGYLGYIAYTFEKHDPQISKMD